MNRRAFLLGAAAVAVPKPDAMSDAAWELKCLTDVPRFDGPLPICTPDAFPLTPSERLDVIAALSDLGWITPEHAKALMETTP